jgi:septum formation inhibitor-activating ATPase MinD
MSIPAIEIVKEFFIINDFYVILKDSFLIVQNSKKIFKEIDEFIIEKEKINFINKAIIKPISWHTLKFTPSVIKKFYEEITFEKTDKILKDLIKDNYKKIIIIPGLPVTTNLKNESIKIMKEKGIDHIILFSSIISGLVEKIDERKLYQSQTLEIIRILKFYKFLSDKKLEKNLFN